MGVSVGLRGNGMVFTLSTLKHVPYRAYSLVEDVEYGIELALQGIRVAYVGDAKVLGEMVADAGGSESQRRRWEQGRRQLLRQYLPRLLKRGIVERNLVLLDLAFDILVPPLATIALYTLGGTAGTLAFVIAGATGPTALVPWLASITGLSVYVIRGVMLSERKGQVLLDLCHVPQYVLWKLALPLRKKKSSRGEWIRTVRNDESR
jgi:cellulose synthase/poly-beta-1,6-N-acetylglucosamine synthase-like glycosyltransferase